MKKPFLWYSDTRSGGGWFVKLNGGQNFLGKRPEDAPRPKKWKEASGTHPRSSSMNSTS
jgi:hypothetical protein